MKNTPSKMLGFLVRLIPFVPYDECNYGLIVENQSRLQLNRDELNKKINMLLMFESQKDVIPIGQFGSADLFETTSNLPTGVYRIQGKFFSSWAVLTLFLTFLMFWSWGVMSTFQFEKAANKAVIIVIIYLCAFAFLAHPKKMLYESLYIIAFFAGLLFGQLIKLSKLINSARENVK
jgi:hypothetical protein